MSSSSRATPGITENSSVTEMMSVLKSSFDDEDYDEAERILIGRERELQVRALRQKRREEKLQKVKKEHAVAVVQKLSAEEELEESRQREAEMAEKLRLSEEKTKKLVEENDQLKGDLVGRIDRLQQAMGAIV